MFIRGYISGGPDQEQFGLLPGSLAALLVLKGVAIVYIERPSHGQVDQAATIPFLLHLDYPGPKGA